MSVTSASELGGAANVIDDIIKIQNEFSCLECLLRTNQMSKLIGINEKPYVQVQKPKPYRSLEAVWGDCVFSGRQQHYFAWMIVLFS